MNSRTEVVEICDGTSSPARSDTFLFPPETTFRFYALLATLFGALTFVWAWLYLVLPSTRRTIKDVANCIRSVFREPVDVMPPVRRMELAQACLHNFNLREGIFVAVCLVVTVSVVLLVHALRPLYIIRAQRLRPLEAVADPDSLPPFRAALDALVAQACLSRRPYVLIRARARTDAFTFGNWFRYYLCLDSGLVSEFFTHRASYDAKVRHELAHFRNKDISKADVTTISWWLFALTVPLVFLYSLAQRQLSLTDASALAWRFAVLVAAVWLARAAVIRAREFDADARAFAWDGSDGALITTLQEPKRAREPWWRLPALMRLHPSNSERAAALKNPGRVLRFEILLLPGVVGLAFGIGEPPGKFVLNFFTPNQLALGGTIVACIFLVPLAGWAGTAIWRDAYCCPGRGRADLIAAALGLAAAAGMIGGFHLSFMDFFGETENPGPALPIIILTLFFLWIRAGAYSWLSSDIGRRVAVPMCWVAIAVGSFVLIAMWTQAWAMNMVHNSSAYIVNMNSLEEVGLFFVTLSGSPLTLLFFVLLWLFIVAPRCIALPSWSRSVAMRWTVYCLAWSLAYAAIVIALRLHLSESVAPEMRATVDFKIWSFKLQLSLAILMQGSLALFMTLCRPAATISEACFCTLIAGILMGIAVLAINRAVGGGLELSFVLRTVCLCANSGAFAALSLAALGAGLRFLRAGFRSMPAVQYNG